MKMNERIREIIHSGTDRNYTTLAVQGDGYKLFPVYFVRMVGENMLAIPVTNATGIEQVLKEPTHAQFIAADRGQGFEAYLLEGSARYVSNDTDFELVAEMVNEVPSFPIHGAVTFQIENVQLIPPP